MILKSNKLIFYKYFPHYLFEVVQSSSKQEKLDVGLTIERCFFRSQADGPITRGAYKWEGVISGSLEYSYFLLLRISLLLFPRVKVS